jgi:hypothetical protein
VDDAVYSRSDGRRIGRVVGIASTIEGLAIFAAFQVLVNVHATDLMLPVTAIIVGLHFIPLARWIPARLYYATGALLILLGAAGFGIGNADQRSLFVGIGAAIILWLTSGVALIRSARETVHTRTRYRERS